MLRIGLLQQAFDLSDTGAEDDIYDRESMQRLFTIESDPVPDESSVPRSRNLHEEPDLTR